jgi:hypothetical protein
MRFLIEQNYDFFSCFKREYVFHFDLNFTMHRFLVMRVCHSVYPSSCAADPLMIFSIVSRSHCLLVDLKNKLELGGDFSKEEVYDLSYQLQ